MTGYTTRMLRYWMLDWFGHFVDHDVLRDRLHTTMPTPERVPGVFFVAPNSLPDRFPVALQKLVSLPMPFPALSAQKTVGNALNFTSSEGSDMRFMRSTPDFKLDFSARDASDWELFYPISERFMRVYSAIYSEATILPSSGVKCESDCLTFDMGHVLKFGEAQFSLSENHSRVAELAALLPLKEETTLTLTAPSGDVTLRIAPRD